MASARNLVRGACVLFGKERLDEHVQANGEQCKQRLSSWRQCLALALLLVSGTAALAAQTFQAQPALAFTKLYQGNDPNPQLVTVASTAGEFSFGASAQTSSGGSWLSVNAPNCCRTPEALTVSVTPNAALAPGTYNGTVTLTSGNQVLTVPVSLIIEQRSAAFFNSMAGGLTFSSHTNGAAPPAQAIDVTNGGSGDLPWTASASTADGGAWLTFATSSGTAPARLQVAVNKGRLPNGGRIAGTFTGQVLLRSGTSRVTIPVTVFVGDAVFQQINPLLFNQAYGAASGTVPAAQVVTVASAGDEFGFGYEIPPVAAKWLSVSAPNCCTTPEALTVSVTPDATMPAGIYVAEIILKSASSATKASVISITLTSAPPEATFFDATPGELTFSLARNGVAPPSQLLPIRNGGSGTLQWTASATTADNGGWLVLSATSGTGDTMLEVSVDPSKLPENVSVAGTYTGQVLLRTGTDTATVPVTVQVGDAVFEQVNPLYFNKTYKSDSNPTAQVITVASTGDNFGFSAQAVSVTGGDWLKVSAPNCCTTPEALTVTVTPDSKLAAGTYFAEIIIKSASSATKSSVVPVTLTVAPSNTAYFGATPGQLTFSFVTKQAAPPRQAVEVRNDGSGTLNWTAQATTSDGGSWLNLSTGGGTAPSTLSVGIDPTRLPDGGQVAGTYTGMVLLRSDTSTASIPVSVTVGSAVFAQNNPLYFTKVYKSMNTPAAQVITVASTGDELGFSAVTVSGSGGDWLKVSAPNCCTTPEALTVTVAPDGNLAAGTYTAEIIVTSASSATQSSVIPVTLTIAPLAAASFDAVQGSLTFSATPGSTGTPAQSIAIRNAGAGTLNWTAMATTADSGTWLSLSANSGTAPTSLQVSVDPAYLPQHGSIAGTYTGQVLLRTDGDAVSIPVSVTIGASVFTPLPALTFSKPVQGADPAAQVLNVASAGSNFGFSATAVSATGGDWLHVNAPNCCTTPEALTVTVTPDVKLPAGTYFAEIILKSASSANQASVIPVTLLVGTTPPPPPATATPVFTLAGGTYTAAQTVTLTDATSGAVIHYTTDGSAPTASSPVYTGALTLSATQTVQAVALASGSSLSGVASATYTFATPSTDVSAITFGDQALSTASAARVVNFINSGANVLSGISAMVTGANASDFRVSSACGTTVAANSSCALSLTFTPAGNGPRMAMLTVAYNGIGSPRTVQLSGNGVAYASQLSLTPSLGNVTYGQALSVTAQLSGSPAPGGNLTYRVDTGAVQTAALASGHAILELGVLAAGAHTLSVGYSGDGTYGPTSQTLNVTVAPATLTVIADNLSRSYRAANPSLTYRVSGFVNGDSGNVVSGSAILATAASATSPFGAYAINFTTQALTALNYVFHYLPGTLTITPAAQTITFPALPAVAIYGQDGPFTLSATADSGLPITYTVSGPASLSGTVLTLTGAGTVTVMATQPGDGKYNAAAPVTQTITVSSAPSSGPPDLVTTAGVSRQSDGSYLVTLVVLNLGKGPATSVTLTSATVGSASTSPFPYVLGDIAPGKYASVTVTLPASAGTTGARVVGRIGGTYTGGTFGGSIRLTLP